MSTQNSGHAPTQFSISTPLQHFRLIEVPEDLLNTITDPTTKTLKFKSAPAATQSKSSSSSSTTTTAVTAAANEGILHLCTHDKAWAVKQVSTSNSVYLVRPITTQSHKDSSYNDADNDNDVQMTDDIDDNNDNNNTLNQASHSGMTGISQINTFLELHPVTHDPSSIQRAVLDLLPIHHHISPENDEVDLDLQASNDAKPPLTLPQLVDHVPAPDSMVHGACVRLGIFQVPFTATVASAAAEGGPAGEGSTGQRCVVPSTRSVLAAWMNIVQTCAIEDIDLASPLSTSTITSLTALVSSSSSMTGDVDAALAEALFAENGVFDAYSLFSSTSMDSTFLEDDRSSPSARGRTLDAQRTCRFVAGLLLSASPGQKMDVAGFLDRWTDLVPAAFVKGCRVDELALAGEHGGAIKVEREEGESGSGSNRGFVEWVAGAGHGGHGNMSGGRGGSSSGSSKIVLLPDMLAALDLAGMGVAESGEGGRSQGAAAGTAGAGAGPGAGVAAGGTSTSAAATVDKKRKWHEKFGAQRNKK